MILIFCLSYLSLYQTIVLIEAFGVDNVKVITSNKSIEKFFLLLYKSENLLYFSDSSSLTLPHKKHQFFLFPVRVLNVLIKKKKAWNYFKVVKNSKVYFFFNSAGFFHAWLIYRLSKNNTLYYKEDLNLDSFRQLSTPKANLNVLFIKLLYNEEVVALDQQVAITYKMSEHYLRKCGAQALDIDHSTVDISSLISSKINLPHGEILYLPPIIDEVKVKGSSYIDFVDTMIDYCQRENITMHLKRHPRSLKKYSKENQLFEIPLYYPANCLIDYKITIGHGTATLFERANQGGLVISVYYLFSNSNNIENILVDYLHSNLDKGKKIFFPKNIHELLNIISIHRNID